MAELLVLAFDTSNPDADLDRMAWKKGHVVDVKPDGWKWGASECLPKFWKVKLPNISVSQVNKFLAVKYDATDANTPVQIREWKLSVNDIPAEIVSTLNNTGEITITKLSAFSGYMKR